MLRSILFHHRFFGSDQIPSVLLSARVQRLRPAGSVEMKAVEIRQGGIRSFPGSLVSTTCYAAEDK